LRLALTEDDDLHHCQGSERGEQLKGRSRDHWEHHRASAAQDKRYANTGL
jgi:hypothetical protein